MYQEIIKFWFDEINPSQHWVKDPAFDELIRKRFDNIHEEAAQNTLIEWRNEPLSALAEIIILDQFSRNLYRDSPLAFANDILALGLSKEAIEKGFDNQMDDQKVAFLYMPFMHSEDREVHIEALALFSNRSLDLKYELMHKEIIDEFGRYPHRNKILGRESTTEELDFLAKPNSSF